MLALLSGCAQTPLRTAIMPPAPHAPAPAPTVTCPQAAPPPVHKPAPLSMEWIGHTLRRIAREPDAAAAAEQQRLQASGTQLAPPDKLELAYLLMARATPARAQTAEAQNLLAGLERQTSDPASRQFIQLMQRLCRQSLELFRLRANLTSSVGQIAVLQKQIEQIKNLEVELQNPVPDAGGRSK